MWRKRLQIYISLSQTLLHTVLLTELPAIDHCQICHRVTCAVDWSHACVIMCWALWGVFEHEMTAAAQLLVELLLEGFAQQVKGKRVHAGVGEGQNPSNNAEHKVTQRRVHLAEERKKRIIHVYSSVKKDFVHFFIFSLFLLHLSVSYVYVSQTCWD